MISPLSIDYIMNLLMLGSTNPSYNELKYGLKYLKSFSLREIATSLQKWTADIRSMTGVELGELHFAKPLLYD